MTDAIRRLLLVAGIAMVAAAAAPMALAQQTGKAASQRPVPRPTLPRDTAGRLSIEREVYRYPRQDRRDPFASLIQTGDIRPIFSDLVLSGILFDPTGRSSMATLKDVSTGDLYRARVGSVLGRIRVTAIRRNEVQFAIDEFGFTRQESLTLNTPRPNERTP